MSKDPADSEIIAVKSLEKYQHYKNRHMVWFKWYIDCINDYRFSSLKDNEKWIFIGLVCLACKCDNKLPSDAQWIARQISSEKSIEKELATLTSKGLLASCYQNAIPIRREEKREEEKREERENTIPTLLEVKEHFTSNQSNITEADKFFNYYEANGWRVGKNPMKKWKSAASGWILRAKDYGTGVTKPKAPVKLMEHPKPIDPVERDAVAKLISATTRGIK